MAAVMAGMLASIAMTLCVIGVASVTGGGGLTANMGLSNEFVILAGLFGIVHAAMKIALAILTVRGRDWARTVLTLVLGWMTAWIFVLMIRVDGGYLIVPIIIGAMSVSLYWLPVSNEYFTQSAHRRRSADPI